MPYVEYETVYATLFGMLCVVVSDCAVSTAIFDCVKSVAFALCCEHALEIPVVVGLSIVRMYVRQIEKCVYLNMHILSSIVSHVVFQRGSNDCHTYTQAFPFWTMFVGHF